MLDVQGRIDVDAGGEQFLHVLPALGVARARDVGVGQLVHQEQARPSRQGGIEVELRQLPAAIGDLAPGQDLQAVQQNGGLGAAVGLRDTHHDIHALVVLLPGRDQHGVGLAHPGAAAEEDLQPPAALLRLLALDLLQQGVGVWALVGHRGPLAWCTGHGLRILGVGMAAEVPAVGRVGEGAGTGCGRRMARSHQ